MNLADHEQRKVSCYLMVQAYHIRLVKHCLLSTVIVGCVGILAKTDTDTDASPLQYMQLHMQTAQCLCLL